MTTFICPHISNIFVHLCWFPQNIVQHFGVSALLSIVPCNVPCNVPYNVPYKVPHNVIMCPIMRRYKQSESSQCKETPWRKEHAENGKCSGPKTTVKANITFRLPFLLSTFSSHHITGYIRFIEKYWLLQSVRVFRKA